MKETLNARFRAPLKEFYRRRILVWRDEAGEFAETVKELQLDNARVLTMEKDGMFQLRRQIEVDYAEENLLIYCPLTFEKPQDNWLLDVFLYSEEFRADYWSLVFDEIGVENSRETREYARSVSAFFGSKERRQRLRGLRSHYANVRELQTGIFAVLSGAKEYGFARVVRQTLTQGPAAENPALKAMAKFCGEEAFWQACRESYGYGGGADPEELACHLLTSALRNTLDNASLPQLPQDGTHALQAYGFFVDFLQADRPGLMELCLRVEARFPVEAALRRLSREELMRVSAFPAADRILLEDTLVSFAEGRLNLDETETLLRARQDQPWAADFAPYYAAAAALADMQRFALAYREGFHFASARELWNAYGRELFRMDQYYRSFCVAYRRALSLGVLNLEDALESASDGAERLYKNGYLNPLNEAWTRLLMKEGLASLSGVPLQQHFYRDCVATADNRVYVIVSDGLRYETARQLAREMTGRLGGNTDCGGMLGLLPGETWVGMAALLPHRRLEMDDGLKIRADGRSTESGDREALLQAVCPESVAMNAAEFRQWGKARRGEWVRGKKVVYLYHNAIDRAGESGGDVLAACAQAVDEILQLMRILVGELNAATVLITADHGFLYTRSPLPEYEKTGKEMLHGEILEYKRRHAVIRGRGEALSGLQIPLTELGREDLTAVFPRGCLRFRLQGGDDRYMHGGASLQEMTLPLIRYQNRRAGQKGFTAITKAEIVLLGENRKISNNLFTLNFYQPKPCGGKVQPRTVLARLEDASGRPVSDEHRLVCNMTAEDNTLRTLRVAFRLLGSGYDRNAEYPLVLRDAETHAELQRIPFRIDVIFENDFDL